MKNKKQQHWDLIGDIHGEHSSLVRLLNELGYSYDKDAAHFFHPEGRKVIFVGDFIDRGPDSRSVLHLVKGMIDSDNALAVMGNHEFNFVSYHTPDPEGGFLRPHSDNNRIQIEATLKSFVHQQDEILEWVEWMKSLPFFLDLDSIRVVHASWIPEDIEFLRDHSLQEEAFLIEANRKGSRANRAIENVLKGVEITLPKGVTFTDSNGIIRKNMRIEWWRDPNGRSFSEVAFPKNDHAPVGDIPSNWSVPLAKYERNEPPVFFGHYKLNTFAPFAAEPNIASLDYGLGHGGKATAYQWNGESEINESHFVQVDTAPATIFELFADDNFHYMNEDGRVKMGEFETYAAALEKAKAIVDEYLEERIREGKSASEAYGSYTSFGDDPWIQSTPAGTKAFSSWKYAENRSKEMARKIQKQGE